MHIALSNTGLFKEELLAVHLLTVYKSSSSQLPFCLPLNVLSALFLTGTLHPTSPPFRLTVLLAKSQLSNCCSSQLSWECSQDLIQRLTKEIHFGQRITAICSMQLRHIACMYFFSLEHFLSGMLVA